MLSLVVGLRTWFLNVRVRTLLFIMSDSHPVQEHLDFSCLSKTSPHTHEKLGKGLAKSYSISQQFPTEDFIACK